MGRKFYNGLRTTLGAALNGSATSVTFSGALTYNNGVALPAVAAGDYVPLTILTPAGRLSEVVWLTNYTPGSTAGTVIRGKDDSIATGHNLGDPVVSGVLASDFAAANRVDNPYDLMWANPLTYDQEYEAEDTSGDLGAGWNWINQDTSTAVMQNGALLVTPLAVGGGGDQNRLIVRSIPSQSAWQATAKITFVGMGTNWFRAGLVLRDSATQKFTFFGRATGGGWGSNDAFINDWSTPSSFSGGEVHVNVAATPIYFRIKRTATPTYDFLMSSDGLSWLPFLTGKTPFATYDQLGFGFNSPVANTSMAVHWFRVR